VRSFHERNPFLYSSSVILVLMGSQFLISSGIASWVRKVASSGQLESSKQVYRVPSIICLPASVSPAVPSSFERCPLPIGVKAACWKCSTSAICGLPGLVDEG
jgi:hypothetical protein